METSDVPIDLGYWLLALSPIVLLAGTAVPSGHRWRRRLRGVSVSNADLARHVVRLVAVDGVSTRDLQLALTQFYRAKSYPTFGPVGPLPHPRRRRRPGPVRRAATASLGQRRGARTPTRPTWCTARPSRSPSCRRCRTWRRAICSPRARREDARCGRRRSPCALRRWRCRPSGVTRSCSAARHATPDDSVRATSSRCTSASTTGPTGRGGSIHPSSIPRSMPGPMEWHM
jgi:hypothetical protein